LDWYYWYWLVTGKFWIGMDSPHYLMDWIGIGVAWITGYQVA
jgi:hypothetical protein